MKLKKNDKVIILAGKDKGKTGEISKIISDKNNVIVAGINMISKHMKPKKDSKGGIQKLEAALDASNVALICPKCNKHMTPKIKFEENGTKSRICRKCKEILA
jgi:large subunit ribosomal protein L24